MKWCYFFVRKWDKEESLWNDSISKYGKLDCSTAFDLIHFASNYKLLNKDSTAFSLKCSSDSAVHLKYISSASIVKVPFFSLVCAICFWINDNSLPFVGVSSSSVALAFLKFYLKDLEDQIFVLPPHKLTTRHGRKLHHFTPKTD